MSTDNHKEIHETDEPTKQPVLKKGLGGLVKRVLLPLFIKLSPILVVVLLATNLFSGIGWVFGNKTTTESKTTDFGLKNIGELATQAGYFTNVQLIKGSQQLFGVDIPLTHSKFIFTYDGTIRAGLQFGDIDVKVDDATKIIRVSLPEVRVLSTVINENSF